MAVGTIGQEGTEAAELFVQVWDGTTWSELARPERPSSPHTTGSFVEDVACTGAGACALQWTWIDYDLLASHPATSFWDGRSWTSTPFGDVAAYPSALDCAPDGSCLSARNEGPTYVWDGDSFEQTAAEPVSLESLSCTAIDHCVGIAFGPWRSLTWNGSAWTEVPMPFGSGSISWEAIDCTSPSSCIAVGGDFYGSDWHAITAGFDGTRWRLVATPLTVPAWLRSVDCASVTECVAVGQVFGGTPVALGWNGGGWYQLDDPPGVAGTYYGAIGCGGDACMAVGNDAQAGPDAPRASTYRWQPSS
jgi:hypothetical protein